MTNPFSPDPDREELDLLCVDSECRGCSAGR